MFPYELSYLKIGITEPFRTDLVYDFDRFEAAFVDCFISEIVHGCLCNSYHFALLVRMLLFTLASFLLPA